MADLFDDALVMARYDDERVPLTTGFLVAVEVLMREQMRMLGSRPGADPSSWTWGRCTVHDLASARGLEFTYGGDDDRPADMTGDVDVVCPLALGFAEP